MSPYETNSVGVKVKENSMKQIKIIDNLDYSYLPSNSSDVEYFLSSVSPNQVSAMAMYEDAWGFKYLNYCSLGH